MVNLVLHPGHSKCGSTTIQDFIYKNRHKLFNRGVYLPDINFNFPMMDGYDINITQTPRDYLAKVQSGEVPLADLEAKLDYLIDNAERIGCRRVIISAENLINAIGNPCTSNIHKLFNQKFASVNIVYYIRRQDALLVSAWQQWGHKDGQSLEDYIERMINTKFCDFQFVTNKLQQYYPTAKLEVFPINREVLHKNSLINDFCNRARILFNGLDNDIQDSNFGLSSALCTSLQKIHHIYENVHDQSIKNKIINLAPHSANLIEKRYQAQLSKDLMIKLHEKFNDGNLSLWERFFPGISFEKTLALSVQEMSDDEITLLKNKIDKLEDLVSIQMDMIMQLSKNRE